MTAKTLTNMLDERAVTEALQQEEAASRHAEASRILAQMVEPHMPRSLADCYRISSVYDGSGSQVSALQVGFVPLHQLDGKLDATEEVRLALGTIDKVVAGLEKGGWTITNFPTAELNYRESLTVSLGAVQQINRSVWVRGVRRLQRKAPLPERQVTLTMTFDRLPETESCRIEEQQVKVLAVGEHYETQKVLVCDDAETPE